MKFPFITRSHHEDVVGRLEKQLADVQAERKAYLDTLAQMGFGVTFFNKDNAEALSTDTPAEQPLAGASTSRIPLSRLRPSQISRTLTAQKEREYRAKQHLNRKAEVLEEVAAVIGDALPQA